MTAAATPTFSRRQTRIACGSAAKPSPRLAAAQEPSLDGAFPIRVLVVFELQYRSYGDAIAGVIRELRPRVEVAVAGPMRLRSEIARRSPHLVISSQPNTADPKRTPVWVELPHEPGLSGAICFDGECLEARDLDLDDLLAVVDRTENLVRAS